MATGAAVSTGDLITAAKMNLKQEDFTSIASLTLLDNNGSGTNQVTIRINETETLARTLNIKINNAARTIDISGDVTLAAALTTTVAAITLAANVAGSSVTLPATGTLATLGGAETLTLKTLTTPVVASLYTDAAKTHLVTIQDATQTLVGRDTTDTLTNKTLTTPVVASLYQDAGKTNLLSFPATTDTVATIAAVQNLTNKTITAAALSGTFTGTPTFSGATITLTGGTINLTAGAGYTIGTTDAQTLTIKTNAVSKFVFTTTLGQFTVKQATQDYTLIFSDPAAARNLTFPDPLGHDTITYLAATQTLTNKTLTTASIGTLTVTASPINFTAGAAVTMGTTDANTLAIKTNGTTRYTFAAATANVTVAGAALWVIPANTAASFGFQDGTTTMLSLDSRNTVSGVVGVTLTGAPPTIVSAGGTTWSSVSIPAVTVTLTGGVQVTALNGIGLNLAQPVVTSGVATTVVTASTLYIANAPSAAGAGPAAITNNYALHVAGGETLLQATSVAGVLKLTNATFNITAGGAFTFGTTDANTLALKTNGTTRWTWAAASANVTIASAAIIAGPAITANMLQITDGTTALIALDSRVAVDNVVVNLLTSPAPTFVSAAGSSWNAHKVAAVSITLTGGVGVTAMDGMQAYFDAPTVIGGQATTVTTASTVYIKPPVQGANMTLTNNRIINTSVAGCFLTAAGVWTDASSAQHKTDIMPVSLAEIPGLLSDLEVVTYKRKDPSDGNVTRFGVIAEDAPDYLASPGHTGVAASYMSGFALAGLKWLQEENMKLKARLVKLEARLAN